MADQQKATSLPLYGNPDYRTPALDALAARGAWARHCFVPQPFCFPSRCSLLTGRYAHAHGVRGQRAHSERGRAAPGRAPEARRLRHRQQRPLPRRAQRRRARLRRRPRPDPGAPGRGLPPAPPPGRRGAAAHRPDERRPPRPARGLRGRRDRGRRHRLPQFPRRRPGRAPFFLQVAWIAPHPPYFLPAALRLPLRPRRPDLPRAGPAGRRQAGRPPPHGAGHGLARRPAARPAPRPGRLLRHEQPAGRPGRAAARGPGGARAPRGHHRGLHRRPRRLRRRARHVGQELHPLRRPRARPPDPGRAGRPRRRGA